ncbi:hypothetical protein HKD37_07G018738 [Glycine soja]
MKEQTETSMSSSLARNPTTMIHPRHEAFEHNFLPILCLIFSNPTQTLIMLKHKLLELSSNQRVNFLGKLIPSVSTSMIWFGSSTFNPTREMLILILNALQLAYNNNQWFMSSQADEEVHQLSYLQKHVANIVSLLAEPVEGEDKESLVC